ncbi:hypothetical protein L218DRAFT_942880 [Marasmius fiardii PR-910]|nr:hypothetical protein L218DRAFT_942880 [Marasmius fiardii PR-910]
MYTYSLLITLLALPFVYPQGQTGTQCIMTCATNSLTAGGCNSLADVNCLCNSAQYQTAVLNCLQANCTPDEVQMAMEMQQQQCASVSGSGSAGGTGSTSSGGTSGTGSGSASTTGSGSSTVLSNPSGTGPTPPPSSPLSTGPGLPSTSSNTNSTSGGTSAGSSQSQTQNAAPSVGGTLIFMHDIIALCVVWIGIVVGGALVL